MAIDVMGYVHSGYAESLAEFGTPRLLPRSGGWLLVRMIAGFAYRDGMGCYPLLACLDWGALDADLRDLSDELVCVSAVTDPFGDYDVDWLRHCFRDVVRPFKDHYVVDLSRPLDSFVSKHHERNARKAFEELQVADCPEPLRFLDEWVRLYAHLVRRHDIRGIPAFSRRAFEGQMQVPGAVVFRAAHEGATVGMTIWYVQGNVGYYHLGAYNRAGYRLGASFALFWHAIQSFSERDTLCWLNLGGGAGVDRRGADGLSRFKRGWATGTRIAYFCGRVFDQARYAELAQAHEAASTDYFPAYRQGEFD